MRVKTAGARSAVCIVVLAEPRKKSTITRCDWQNESCGCLNRESLRDRAKMRERQVAGGLAIKGRPDRAKVNPIYESDRILEPRGAIFGHA